MLEGLDVFSGASKYFSTAKSLNFAVFSAYSCSALNLREGDCSLGFCCIAVILVSEAWGLLCCVCVPDFLRL